MRFEGRVVAIHELPRRVLLGNWASGCTGFSETQRPYMVGRWMTRKSRVLGETLWVRLFAVGMTQPGNDKHMQTYSLGETIRLELDLLDRSGVLTVNAAFYETESGHGFSMRGDGGGRSKVTVVLAQEVTDKTLPGEYRCKDVTVYDTHHNYATYTPDIRFRIETPWGTMRGRSSWAGKYPSSKLTLLGG